MTLARRWAKIGGGNCSKTRVRGEKHGSIKHELIGANTVRINLKYVVVGALSAGAMSVGVASAMPVEQPTAHATKSERGPRGPKGAKGDKGAQGPQGLQGVAGAAGAAGLQGPMGPAGPQGQIGPPGPAGTPTSTNLREFTFKADENTASTDVTDLDGVKLLASCSALGRLTLNAVATNIAPGILTERDGLNFNIVPRFGEANTTGVVLVSPLSGPSSRADIEVHYVSNAGQDTTISIAAADLADGPNGLGEACVVFGDAATF
jgi:hypothetical protein